MIDFPYDLWHTEQIGKYLHVHNQMEFFYNNPIEFLVMMLPDEPIHVPCRRGPYSPTPTIFDKKVA